ncbi:MAG: MFS transporter [Chloroflexi bacterium]|nr:MFS transporter [Chloroflexota bacterium]
MILESWQKNLYIISIAEFTVLMGFGVVMPFLPLFIRQLGSYSDQEAAFWAGIATGVSGIAMFLSAPLWGMVADRWGRKPMLLRAQFGAAIVIALAGLSTNVYQVTGLRFMQGILAGTVPAASALVASITPRDRLPFAMGLILVSVQAGNTMGPVLGGVLADRFGFRETFFIASGLLFLGGLAVLLLVKEKFIRPADGHGSGLRDMLHLAFSREMLPLLMVIGAINIGPSLISPIIPLLIQGLAFQGSGAGAAGLAFSLIGTGTAVSAFVAGRIAGRIPLRRILVFCCVGTGVLYLPPIWAQTVTHLVIFVGATGLLSGGLVTASSSLISLSVPQSRQGIAYGLAQSANALGSGVGPFIGGSLASLVGLRTVFAVAGGFFVMVGVVVTRLLLKRPAATQ